MYLAAKQIGAAITKILKISGLLAAGLAGLILVAAVAYLVRYYPRRVESFEVNSADLPNKVLIATQGSDFKRAVVDGVCRTLGEKSIYVKVVDVRELDHVEREPWQAILVINTVMMDKMDSHVERFVARPDFKDDVLLLVTAGGADFKPADLPVDAISGASRRTDVDCLIGLITDWMDHRESTTWEPADPVVAMEYFLGCDIVLGCDTIRSDISGFKARYPDLEVRLNRVGYHQLRCGHEAAALRVLQLNSELFPDSWNAHDSYGEALVVSGDHEAATTSYRRSLQLNPASQSGKKALKMLTEAS